MPYATKDDVQELTGVSVDSTMVAKAQAVIEIFTNRSISASGSMSTGDLRVMKMAVAYQTAYMDEHPELFTLMDVASLSQEGLSVSFRGSPEQALIAPLARMALRRASWKKARSISVKTDAHRSGDPLSDDELAWRKM